MDNFLESITGQLSSLGLGDGMPKKADIPPHLLEDIRTIQERALKMVTEASRLSSVPDSMPKSHELVQLAAQLLSFTKHFLEEYHGKPDQTDS